MNDSIHRPPMYSVVLRPAAVEIAGYERLVGVLRDVFGMEADAAHRAVAFATHVGSNPIWTGTRDVIATKTLSLLDAPDPHIVACFGVKPAIWR